MKNNLLKLIQAKGLTQVEFGKLVWGDEECETELQIKSMQTKISRYCDMNLKSIKLDLMHRFAVVLNCSYNELYGYENS